MDINGVIASELSLKINQIENVIQLAKKEFPSFIPNENIQGAISLYQYLTQKDDQNVKSIVDNAYLAAKRANPIIKKRIEEKISFN